MAYESKCGMATAYAVLSVKTAYLLRYYAIEYWTAYLNSILGNQDKLRQYLTIVKEKGIKVSRPDINKCNFNFTCEDKTILMGLTSLKNVGVGIEEAIKERDLNGKFKDLQDLLTRVPLNKREIESLIKAGAFDSFGLAKRSQMLSKLEDILKLTKNERTQKNKGQISLFDITYDEEILNMNKIEFPNIEEFSPMRIFTMEKEVSGFYLSGHPLNLPEYKAIAKKSTMTTMDDFTELDNKKKVKLVGVVVIDEKQKEGIKVSKNGNQYASFRLEDLYGQIKVLGFKEVVEKAKNSLFNNTIVEIEGTLSVSIEEYMDDNGDMKEKRDIKIFLNDLNRVTSLEDRKKVFIQLNTKNQQLMSSVRSICNRYPGFDTVMFYDTNLKKSFQYNKTIGYCNEFYNEIINRIRIKPTDLVVKNLA